jgi:DNA invertase Pin-like site-specific DNA recombinase
MKPFGYIRVSGRGQVDGDGPERQKDIIQKFCSANGLEDISPGSWYSEEAVSGTVEAMSRPMFAALLDDIVLWMGIHSDAKACIVVERMDRLARDLIVSELLLKECTARGIQVYAADQGLQDQASADADPTRKLIRQIMGALAEWEKSVIVKKLRAARDRKRQETGRCEGIVPFGGIEGEKEAFATMQRLHGNGVSYSRIAFILNDGGCWTRGGKPWTKAAVYQVLNRR